jgi:hypothetical protein
MTDNHKSQNKSLKTTVEKQKGTAKSLEKPNANINPPKYMQIKGSKLPKR